MKRNKWQWTITRGARVNVYQGNGERFAALFKDVWQRIPLGVRRLLLRGWRIGFPIVSHSPCIEMLEGWARMGEGDIAAVYCRGHQLRFCSSEIDRRADDDVRFTIAHELAHCVQEFRGDYSREDWNEYYLRGPSFFLIEQHADEMAEEWLRPLLVAAGPTPRCTRRLTEAVSRGVQQIIDGRATSVLILPE